MATRPPTSETRLAQLVTNAPALAALALAFVLQIFAIHAQSLSGDGAYHLLAGHQALRYGQNVLNWEHPPLVKLVLALPLLLEDEPLSTPVRVEDALAAANGIYAHESVHRATVRGRYVALFVFVIPFLLVCHALGRHLGGERAGFVLVLLLAFSLAVLPYLTLLQTDVAVALAFVSTALLGMRFVDRPSWGGALSLGLAAGFALAVKFSGLLLGPAVLAAFFLAPRRSWAQRLGQLFAAGLVVVLVLEASYLAANWNYDSELGRATIRAYCENRGTLAVAGEMRSHEETLLAVKRVEPRFAQWLTGFLGVRIQNAIGVYPSYAFGEVSSQGRWWYFPAVFLVKTPLVLLLTLALAFVAWFRRRRFERAWIVPGLVVAVYLAAALASNYNLSVRHLLPVMPFLYLPAAIFLTRRRSWRLAAVSLLAAESLVLAPLWMSHTNTWWLGERNPTRFALSAGNLEYRQNFIQLARVARERQLEPLHVLYPALPDAVVHTYLPDARLPKPGTARLTPGWYAVNVTVEQFVPALLEATPGDVYNHAELRRGAERWRPLWEEIVERGEDHGFVAGTFHLYRLGRRE